VTSCFSIVLFKIIFLSLAFESLTMWLFVILFEFILRGVYQAFWMFIFMSFMKVGKFSAIIS